MQIVRFLPRHLFDLELQPAQAELQSRLKDPEYGVSLALAGPCFTVLADLPVACGGVIEYHPGRAEMWGLLSLDSAPLMRPMTKAIRGWIDQSSYTRLEVNVATEFEAGHRWATLLGFQVEGPEKLAFTPGGGGAIPYVRIRCT